MEAAVMESVSHSKDYLKPNMTLWLKNHRALPEIQSNWEFCKTGKKKQLNLYNKGLNFYLHSSQNIDVEVRQWIGQFDPNKIEWVVIFGVGLGYYYLGLKSWLEGNPKRRIIIIEDDLEVLYSFLETNVSEKVLTDSQVNLMYLPKDQVRVAEFEDFIRRSIFRELHFDALASYQKHKNSAFENLKFIIRYFRGIQESSTAEYLTLGKTFFKNFYHNVLELDTTLNGASLIGKFKGMPAIICGAGPSLEKNIDVLKSLKDKALIIAGGTAMNALNAYHFLPHFGCGIDPFSFHFSRIISNIAFEIPYFFRSRMTADAVAFLHGPKIYLPGTSGYPIADFVDNQLKYPPFQIDEGANVINTSLSIAEKLGCNPIICVGLDLAYTDGLSYAPGITSHGIHDPREQFITKSKHDELILSTDIYGQPIYTLMKWMVESTWYSNFARNFPEIKLINCTEGGIGFAGVENMPLEEAKNLFLKENRNIESKIAAALLAQDVQYAPSLEEIKKVLSQIVTDLDACATLMTSFQEKHPKIWFEKLPEPSEPLKLFEKELEKLPVYHYLLKPFDLSYKTYMGSAEHHEIKAPESEIQEVLKGRFPYLADIVVQNLKYIQKAIKRKVSVEISKSETKELPLTPLVDQASDEVTICTEYYPNGQVLSSISYKNGVKHGHCKIFSPSNLILSDRVFIEGVEQGNHLYFYKDGKLKSVIPYKNGLLDGEVHLYYPNGSIKRSSAYVMGKRHGIDIIYAINGSPLLKAEYQNDKPIGKALKWHMDGAMALEVSYFTPGVIAQIKRWDSQGQLIEDQQGKMDFMDTAVMNSLQLQNSISGMAHGLEDLMHSMQKDFPLGIQKDLEKEIKSVENEMLALGELSNELLETSGIGREGKEAIWKTPSNEVQLDAFLQGITAPMQESMVKLQWQLRSMIEKVQKQSSDESKSKE